jgi:Holliday junction resolvasome RuvABC ATP-dependent DNA helicase subunit
VLSERANELNDVKPTSIFHIVGQRSVIRQVSVALDAAHMDSRPFEHSLLVGPPGLGNGGHSNDENQMGSDKRSGESDYLGSRNIGLSAS